ncbi:hypothetical protein CALVIDRAFT_599398 [Calocera viscosa TUFC12733]|uniref:Uncharacterized protein n=1 Tax=Calocera viscosa (strain TUFC12733) TaxID=1330018 RepID=A0A167L296_CALVF|nr:hypothetical protein CALVIDRAFT_599398 [Calocera viscosa TUFC12733]
MSSPAPTPTAQPQAEDSPAPTGTYPPPAPEEAQYRLPPFIIPPGVSVTSFADFEPGGILLPTVTVADGAAEGEEADAEEAEVDGSGVYTVQLETSHEPIVPAPAGADSNNTDPKADQEKTMPADAAAVVAAHKRRRNKGRQAQLKELGFSADGAPGERRLTWWEKWELEDLKKRGSGVNYNLGEDRSDRLDLAVKMFRKGHAMEAGVQSIWDRWLDYIGLMRNENQYPGAKKISRGIQRRGEEDDSDEEMEAEPEVNLEELWEERVIRFLENPTNALRRFFSSTYHEEGLYWSDAKLRDGPILVSIFLRYLLQERVVPEYAADLTQARDFLEEHIKHDLLATRAFSMGAEDDFSAACCADLGTQVLQDGMGRWVPAGLVLEQRARRDRQLLEAREREKREMEEERLRRKEEREQAVAAGIGIGEEGSAWGQGNAWTDGPVGWDEPHAWTEDDPLQAEGTAADMPWGAIRMPTLAPLCTPLTHSLLRTERSVRRITAVRPPDPAHPDPLRQKYATVVFEPWLLPEVVKEDAVLRPPELLYEAEGEEERSVMRSRGGGHSLGDTIELLVEPEHAERARKGLGVYAVWVQAARTGGMPEDASEPANTDAVEPATANTTNVTDATAAANTTTATPAKPVKSYASATKPTNAPSTPPEDESSGSTTPTLTASPISPKKKRRGKDKGPKAETFWFFQHVTIVVPGYWLE